MITVTHRGETFMCATAIRGTDYVHLIDSDGSLIASFEGIRDHFQSFSIEGGEWTLPAPPEACRLAVVCDDGTIKKSNRKCNDLFGFVRQLTSEDDLNTLTETGVYTYSTSSVPKNCPYNNAGTVEVIGTGFSSGTKQVVTRYGAVGESRFRMQYEGNWQDWERYTVYKDHTTLGFDTVVKPSVGKSYQSIEKNGLKYKGAVMSGNAFPNGVFLIALNSESSGGSSLYLVALGPTLESAPVITRLSVIYDNTPYPCIEATQSGYLYTSWSANKTADIRANIFKLA